MTDLIPSTIYKSLAVWLLNAKDTKAPSQVTLHVNGDGKIVQADRVVKERVTVQ